MKLDDGIARLIAAERGPLAFEVFVSLSCHNCLDVVQALNRSVAGARDNIGNGVAYCPHCDGPFFKGRDMAVSGGGNSGVEAALDLSGIDRSVTMLEFMPALKADTVLIDQGARRDNIRMPVKLPLLSRAAPHQPVSE